MMASTATEQSGGAGPGPGHARRNPWANDYTLMTLSLWWVQRTRPGSADFNDQVSSTMASLARQLR